jgi:hypothetical protein
MAKNLGQICEAAAEQIERMFGNSELDIVRYINSAQKELALDTNKRTSGTVSVSNGTGSLPSDCLFVDKVFLNGNEIKPNESDSKYMNQNVSGTRWFVDDDDLKIIPSTSGDYEISYIATPEELVDDEDVPVFNGADEYFIAYAVWKASSDIEGATNRTAYLFQELERERSLWKKLDDKKVDRPHFVKTRPWV